jgi:ketosteroid isomerase-like protein
VLTDRTILLEPDMKPLVGKEAIGKMHQAFLAAFDIDAKGPATDVRVAGGLAVPYGRYEETITPKDTTLAAEQASGHWLDALERQGGACVRHRRPIGLPRTPKLHAHRTTAGWRRWQA